MQRVATPPTSLKTHTQVCALTHTPTYSHVPLLIPLAQHNNAQLPSQIFSEWILCLVVGRT